MGFEASTKIVMVTFWVGVRMLCSRPATRLEEVSVHIEVEKLVEVAEAKAEAVAAALKDKSGEV